MLGVLGRGAARRRGQKSRASRFACGGMPTPATRRLARSPGSWPRARDATTTWGGSSGRAGAGTRSGFVELTGRTDQLRLRKRQLLPSRAAAAGCRAPSRSLLHAR